MLALVIGKEVPGRPGLRYVRKVGEARDLRRRGQDRQALHEVRGLYRAQPAGHQQFDVKRLWIRDYSVDQLRQGAGRQRGDTDGRV